MKPPTQLKSSATQKNETHNTIEIFCNTKLKPPTQLKSSATKKVKPKTQLKSSTTKNGIYKGKN
jgi:hypothetical protein